MPEAAAHPGGRNGDRRIPSPIALGGIDPGPFTPSSTKHYLDRPHRPTVCTILPVLTRPMAGPPNPGLDDRNYLPGLLWFVAAMWVLLLTAAAARAAWRRRSSDSPDAGRRPLDTN
ncbi:hypothetical protein GCM10027290_17560 [Micromonospora sonneratiae]